MDYSQILNDKQIKLLPAIKNISNHGFGMIGGTAIALQLGHRQSIDFDLCNIKEFNNAELIRIIGKTNQIEKTLIDNSDEYTAIVDGVKLTCLYYPFPVEFKENIDNISPMADLLTLGAMKAYTLGRRVKWKDYVDLYFIMENNYPIQEIIAKSKQIFGTNFNEKLFRVQLAYFEDIDYSEEINYLPNKEIPDEVIKKKLIEWSLAE